MPELATRTMLRRLAIAFAVTCLTLTTLMLANYAMGRVQQLTERGVPVGTIVEALLLAVPFMLAMTVPMAVLISVLWVFTRLAREGVLASAQQAHNGVRRLVTPVLGAAAVIGTLTLVSNSQIVPRANARLTEVLSGASRQVSDRTMTIGQLRDAARRVRANSGQAAAARAAAYEVEIHKKLALAFACVVFALAGAAIVLRFPRGRVGLVIGAAAIVFTAYYVSIMAGESLADRQVISPFAGMWLANALLLAVVLLMVWRREPRIPAAGPVIE
jgi:lipopolysaccharide export LptBFGC system permease protein LptF